MDDKTREFHIGSLIELKEGFDQYYPHAQDGDRAVVKDIKEADGFLMLYVQWADNTEEPGWSFASHFHFIRDSDEILPQLRDLTGNEEAYMDRVFQAIDAASDSEAFFMITLKKEESPQQGKMLLPQIFCVANSEAAAFLIESQIMQIASDMFRNAVSEAIQQFNDLHET